MGKQQDHVAEAIALMDKSAERTRPNAQTQAWATIRAHIEGLSPLNYEERCRLRDAEARVRELEPNASRYLYLRDNTSVMLDGDRRWLTSHRLDAAIDTAMQASREGR